MKRIALAFLLFNLAAGFALAQINTSHDARSKITVTGEAVVNATPDKIVITFGIETWDTDILAAKQENNNILQQTLRDIEALGVPDNEIQTDHLSIEPRYKYDYDKENFIGYFVRNTFVVTLTEADKVEALVTKALEAGVNYIHGVDFQTTAFKQYREQARDLALRAAREKAMQMAGALGRTVGTPIQINENYSGSPWRYYSSWSGWGYGRGRGMSQNVIQNIQNGAGGTFETIALGKISIRAGVTVTFELLD